MNGTLSAFVYAAGVYNILFAVFHLFFWKLELFNWNVELPKMSPLNSGVMQVLNLCLIVIFILMGFMSFYHNKELLGSSLGKTILFGFSVFWLLRLIEQFVFFWNRGMGYRGMILPAVLLIGFLLYSIPSAALLVKK